MAKKETLGYAEVAAYMHRDNGGKASVKTYSSVNKPHKTDGHEETTRIAGRRFKLVEEELAELNGSKFYEKNFDNIQEEIDKQMKNNPSSSKDYYDNEPEEKYQKNYDPEAGLTHKTATLKNMIDNVMSDNRFQWIAIVGLAILITAVTLALRG